MHLRVIGNSLKPERFRIFFFGIILTPVPLIVNMKDFTILFGLLAPCIQAWIPEDRELAAFNRSDGSNGFLSKRIPSLPSYKLRGVNLGGWLISEPWMMSTEWQTMG